jgi:hypothetical protein
MQAVSQAQRVLQARRPRPVPVPMLAASPAVAARKARVLRRWQTPAAPPPAPAPRATPQGAQSSRTATIAPYLPATPVAAAASAPAKPPRRAAGLLRQRSRSLSADDGGRLRADTSTRVPRGAGLRRERAKGDSLRASRREPQGGLSRRRYHPILGDGARRGALVEARIPRLLEFLHERHPANRRHYLILGNKPR